MKVGRKIVLAGLGVGLGLSARMGWADPLPGEDTLKFTQKPEVALTLGPAGSPTYFGHDELSTVYGSGVTPSGAPPYQGRFMADDFADNFDRPVLHLKWWGSYMGPEHFTGAGVKFFYIGFESDVPADPTGGGFSHPGAPLLQQWVAKGPLAPGSGTFTETLIRGPDPVLGESLYEYNSELKCPFPQHRDTVYWLKIAAMVNQSTDGPIQWGWHNRDYTIMDPLASPVVVPGEKTVGFLPGGSGPVPVWHFQDDAVNGTLITTFLDQCSGSTSQTDMLPQNYIDLIDGPAPIGTFSKDLAFELYTNNVPEPGMMGLIGAGWVILSLRRRR